MIEQFHFLRPLWLLALLPVAVLLWYMLRNKYISGSWHSVVDPELLKHLLVGQGQARHLWPTLLMAVVGLSAVVALAGPVWEKLPQPIYKPQAALVIALDLSRSMDANDIKPSRLTRARHKVADILAQRREGQTALIAYAADAFTVTPLTEDSETINALLPSLSTDIMPTQGGRVDRAVKQALELLSNAGVVRGDLLIVSDGFSATEVVETERLLRDNTGLRISVLGIGTESGGPIPLAGGGFLKDSQGAIVIPQMQVAMMRGLAAKASGNYSSISTNDEDVQVILEALEINPLDTEVLASERGADVWREQGPWILLILLPLIALAFRRGVLLLLPLMILPVSPDVEALAWDEFWQNQNQRAGVLFQQGAHEEAAGLFERSQWKASALYRAGKYDEAMQLWEADDGETSQYNRANALAKTGRYEDAIKLYDKVLTRNPQHQDASYNKQLLEDLLNQQQQQDSKQDQSKGESQESEPQDQGQNKGQGQQQAEAGSDSSQDEESESQQDSEQQQSSEAQSEAMGTQAQQNQPSESETAEQTTAELDVEDPMSEQAANQWLRKIPDDPGGLLRRKFIYQYKKRTATDTEINQW